MTEIDQAPHNDVWIERRLELEERAITHERSRVSNAMNSELIAAKQRLLSEAWARMQELVSSDKANENMYRQICPQIFGPLSQKFPKKRSAKKPTIPKIGINATKLLLGEASIINDMCGIPPPQQNNFVLTDGTKLMITATGQKWVVKIQHVRDDIFTLTYCDGSSSQLLQSDIPALGLKFTDVPTYQ
ncbi:hypothetical protein TVAG_189710 [Trichomonas vaginalis G3]|uniref:Uncharacterized protein n=1 Tax=Trichomonas vaginalis (strain ATCC PRA-98 / G3) TaxID=412133 RepID=A2DKA3_TRIV3|nr:hypothetical protein TVAGG3_0995850 [Trichomonas vaginalis G3]EAY19080.1 hypothetical protein TVAG_189710 [Trichomonas vaginalis G3]KAI5490380.1 hypothetical protein TVAGG3_0995850 [Trichomonas vaginalis G3]|eukprot:XP_001580066.1 hypothetical protein [Trichomonas vaginalis G3]